MRAIINGKVVLPDRAVENACLLFDEKIIGLTVKEALPKGTELIDAGGALVIPGLIDMHIHGYLGEDASDGSVRGHPARWLRAWRKTALPAFCPPP